MQRTFSGKSLAWALVAFALSGVLSSSCRQEQNAQVDVSGWAPVEGHILTPWAGDVDPSAPLPENPRPQLVRGTLQNLNGLWDYAITPKDEEQMPTEAQGKILVPYPVESALSGVGKSVTGEDALWYRTTFRVPRKWMKKGAVTLNFGAVDYSCEVFLNGSPVGAPHLGGYTEFSYDITKFLVPGEQTLVVKVLDGTDNDTQPRGKQVMNPGGIWYTPVTGIWQTVYLENVPSTRFVDYSTVSDTKAGTLRVVPVLEGAQPGDEVSAVLYEPSEAFRVENPLKPELLSATATVAQDGRCELEFTMYDPTPMWTPSHPFIYPLHLSVKRGGKVLDEVSCYAAFRDISVMEDGDSHKRMALNGEPLFHYGPLDQGWWPDGLYTAPTDEALAYDIIKTKDFGYNMIRKHIKVEPRRWYYWCDVLGVMVWQDMPCITDSRHQKWDTKGYGGTDWDIPEDARATYFREWGEIIAQHKVHSSIVVWVPFNEAWGQFDTKGTVDFTKSADPTRLVNPASGGNFSAGVGDILDCHNYPHPAMPVRDPAAVNVLGEYGGIGLALEGHLWKPDRNWGYVQFKTGEEVLAEYSRFADMLKDLVREGCAAAVYTQTTDVEIEVNGLMTYDRKVVKMDEEKLREVNLSVISSMGQ